MQLLQSQAWERKTIKKQKKLFLLGYEKMLEVLEPETIIFYGSIPQECRGNIVRIKAFHEKFIEARMAKC